MADDADVQRCRLALLLATCLDVSFGSLWWVREDLWKEVLRPYDDASDRLGHPGLSVRRSPVSSLLEIVPMLHGTTGAHGPVVARGLTQDEGPQYPTSFGRLLLPADIPVMEFVQPARDADPSILSGPWHRRHRITGNVWKPRLNDPELQALEVWATGLKRV